MKIKFNHFFADRYLQQLNDMIKKAGTEGKEYSFLKNGNLGHYFYKLDFRTNLFYLEGLARIDRKIGKEKDVFKKLLPVLKKAEDLFGNYDYWYAFLNQARPLNLRPELMNYIQEKTNMAAGALEYVLKTEAWVVPQPDKSFKSLRAEEIAGEIHKTKWRKNQKKEDNKLLFFLRDEALKIDRKINSGEIDLENLENGIHEFRREIRWFSIYRRGLSGKIQFSPLKKDDPLSGYITQKELDSPYNKQEMCPTGINPLTIHLGAYMAMSFLLAAIGTIKDNGLFTSLMENAYHELGLLPEEIPTVIEPYYITHKEIVAQSKNLINKFVIEDKGMICLADHFDQQIK